MLFLDADCHAVSRILSSATSTRCRNGAGLSRAPVLDPPPPSLWLATRLLNPRSTAPARLASRPPGAVRATRKPDGGDSTPREARRLPERDSFGGDVDLAADPAGGGRSTRRPDAVVHPHLHREDLLCHVPRLLVRYAAGASWLNERCPAPRRAWTIADATDVANRGPIARCFAHLPRPARRSSVEVREGLPRGSGAAGSLLAHDARNRKILTAPLAEFAEIETSSAGTEDGGQAKYKNPQTRAEWNRVLSRRAQSRPRGQQPVRRRRAGNE